MTDNELQTEFAKLIPLPSRRYRQMRLMLARQTALRAAGPNYEDYWIEHRARLIYDAGELIERLNRRAEHYRQSETSSEGKRADVIKASGVH